MISTRGLVWTLAIVLFWLSPLDPIPDFIPGGIIDDLIFTIFGIYQARKSHATAAGAEEVPNAAPSWSTAWLRRDGFQTVDERGVAGSAAPRVRPESVSQLENASCGTSSRSSS
jgi:uncharacterized membrane protein YkvA (DUF1232 family)